MGIQEDIFEDFFSKLEKDADFPNEIVGQLRKLWKSKEAISKEKILKALTGGVKHDSNSQGY